MNTPHRMATGRSLALDWRHAREKLAAGLGMPGWMLFDEAGHGGRRPAGADVSAMSSGNSVAPLLPDFVRVTRRREVRAGLHPIARFEDLSRKAGMPLLSALVHSVFHASAARLRATTNRRRAVGMAPSAARRGSASPCGVTDLRAHEEGERA